MTARQRRQPCSSQAHTRRGRERGPRDLRAGEGVGAVSPAIRQPDRCYPNATARACPCTRQRVASLSPTNTRSGRNARKQAQKRLNQRLRAVPNQAFNRGVVGSSPTRGVSVCQARVYCTSPTLSSSIARLSATSFGHSSWPSAGTVVGQKRAVAGVRRSAGAAPGWLRCGGPSGPTSTSASTSASIAAPARPLDFVPNEPLPGGLAWP